ncbi:MAG TPA: DUF948 domain-containing protein [Candidatus Eisenbacteria bacterium]|jgi:uncharacterized protein YoxC|nr:DUF948 domain-containing protein [Candidatus Eisenbacteria bacterium]
MTPLSWIAVASVVVALTLVVIAVFLVRLLIQLRRTAGEVEVTARQARPVLQEIQMAVHELRGTAGHLTSTVARLDRFVGSLEQLGDHASRAGSVVLSGFGGPVGRVAAIWTAVRTGAGIFQKFWGRNHKKPPQGREAEEAKAAARES